MSVSKTPGWLEKALNVLGCSEPLVLTSSVSRILVSQKLQSEATEHHKKEVHVVAEPGQAIVPSSDDGGGGAADEWSDNRVRLEGADNRIRLEGAGGMEGTDGSGGAVLWSLRRRDEGCPSAGTFGGGPPRPRGPRPRRMRLGRRGFPRILTIHPSSISSFSLPPPSGSVTCRKTRRCSNRGSNFLHRPPDPSPFFSFLSFMPSSSKEKEKNEIKTKKRRRKQRGTGVVDFRKSRTTSHSPTQHLGLLVWVCLFVCLFVCLLW